MSLDVLTPRGQESVRHERRAIDLFHQRFELYELRQTPKKEPADVDGMVYKRGGELYAIVETKCRAMTFKQFSDQYEARWLITKDKLDRGRKLALSLRVPFVGLLYLIPDDTLLVQRIFNDDGSKATEIDSRRTETQETINGGQIVRLNSYVLVSDRPRMQEPKAKPDWSAGWTRDVQQGRSG